LPKIANNLNKVNQLISDACKRVGRVASDVKIIAVTKSATPTEIRELLQCEKFELGESRVQDALSKSALLNQDLTWHLIGRLQSNKINRALELFSYIHSLDQISHAKQIDKRAGEKEIIVSCFVQVNISEETTKGGVTVSQLNPFIKELAELRNIRIVGLMTMAPHYDNPEFARPIFHRLKELQEELNEKGLLSYRLNELSMGMSNDFEIAIEEGATCVRLGSILFN